MGRLFGGGLFLLGSLVSIVGYGLYRRPKLDWTDFADTCRMLAEVGASEAVRIAGDPIALVGIVTFAAGLILAFNGLKELILGRRKKKFSEIWNGKM